MFEVVERATLLFPSPSATDPNRKHLFIILTNPCGPAKQVLLTSVSTMNSDSCDGSCILLADDHEFLNHKSFVNYAFCRTEPEEKLIKGVQTNEFTDKGLISELLFKRVIQGLRNSRHTKPFALQFLNGATEK